jgi:PilM
MWMIMILVVMMSVTGYYTLANDIRNPPPISIKGTDFAASMAIYRAAVITYATQYYALYAVNYSGVVADGALPLPSWYRLPAPALWTNYLAPDGTILIYTLSALPVNIVAELTDMSKNSVLVGEYNATTNRIDSPVAGLSYVPGGSDIVFDAASKILLTLPPGTVIPDRSPIWLAYRD